VRVTETLRANSWNGAKNGSTSPARKRSTPSAPAFAAVAGLSMRAVFILSPRAAAATNSSATLR
jgi:hypothetical protein